MQLKALARPAFLVPLLVLVWVVISLPLSVMSHAAAVTDPACNTNTSNGQGGWASGIWGMPGIDPYFTGTQSHLKLVDPNNACYQVNKDLKSGYLVYGEWWKDYPNDRYGCTTPDAKTAYKCSDEDKNWYLKLSSSELTAAGVSSGEIKNLQRWSECKAGQKSSTKWCNFLTETIPAGGNYGFWSSTQADPSPTGDPSKDWDPTNDQGQVPDPCLDNDFNPATTENNPCKGKNIQISFTGARVLDNNHMWKEIHPVRKEAWTDSNGSQCHSVNDTDQRNPTTCTTGSSSTSSPATTSGTTTPTTTSGTTTTKK